MGSDHFLDYLLFKDAKEEGCRSEEGTLNHDWLLCFWFLRKVKEFEINKYNHLGAIIIYARREGILLTRFLRERKLKTYFQVNFF